MIIPHKSSKRGYTDLGWLVSRHSFSFGQYYNQQQMGFECLRAINDDHVIPGAGFGTHSHDNMEIISYVLSGALEHKDSLGNSSVIRRGEVLRMSAGKGINHSEYNHSPMEPVHFLQIWVLPNKKNLSPDYQQQFFPEEEKRNQFRLVASQTGREGSISINQDVDMSLALIETMPVVYPLQEGRCAWIHIAKGQVRMNDFFLSQGDGVMVRDETSLNFEQGIGAEVIVFDMK